MAVRGSRAVLAAALALLAPALAGCGDTPFAAALRPAETLDPAPVPAEGGPLLLMTRPRRVALSPVQEMGARVLWRGDGNLALATEGARVVATAGLAQQLLDSRLDGPDPLEEPRALTGRETPLRRVVDLAAGRDPAGMRFGLVLDCVLRAGPAGAGVLLVEEACAGEGISFANRYWAAAETGTVLRSEQWGGDAVGMLVLQLQP